MQALAVQTKELSGTEWCSVNFCWMNEWPNELQPYLSNYLLDTSISTSHKHLKFSICQTALISTILLQMSFPYFPLSLWDQYTLIWLPKAETWAPCMISPLCFHLYLIINEVSSVLTFYISRLWPCFYIPSGNALAKILSLLSWIISIVN